METFEREIELKGDADGLPEIVEFVEDACEACGVEDDARFDMALAVEEACCNVIEHAYSGEGGPLTIRFSANESDVVITLVDQGLPFEPKDVRPPDVNLPLQDRRIGGLGLHLMKQLMDEVRFSFSREGNVLQMIKRKAIAGPRGRTRANASTDLDSGAER